MQRLVQIIYISRSTFESQNSIKKIEPNVVRILAKSRINNRKNGLVGVLYFCDGVFFQCLEGEEKAIDSLFTKIEKDPRHKDIKIISKKYISTLSFSDWAMKYALSDEKIVKFLKDYGYKTFDPYVFTDEMTRKLVSLLIDADDPTIYIDSDSLNNTQLAAPTQKKYTNLNILSLFLSIIAISISVVTLLFSKIYF